VQSGKRDWNVKWLSYAAPHCDEMFLGFNDAALKHVKLHCKYPLIKLPVILLFTLLEG
jgi:hypothetical protein